MGMKRDLTGLSFGEWTVLGYVGNVGMTTRPFLRIWGLDHHLVIR